MAIHEDSISLEPGQRVELFEIDITPLGGNVERFFDGDNAADTLGRIMWKGNPYFPIPVTASGFRVDGGRKTATANIVNIKYHKFNWIPCGAISRLSSGPR